MSWGWGGGSLGLGVPWGWRGGSGGRSCPQGGGFPRVGGVHGDVEVTGIRGAFIWFGIGGSVGPGASLWLGGPWGRGHPWDSGVPGSEGVFTHPPPYVQDLGNAATPPGATQPSVPQFPLRRCTRRTAEPPRDPSPPTGGGNPRWGRPRETAAPLPMGRIRAAGTARPRYAAEGPLHW